MPTIDEINEVAESLLKGGTRYRSEKIAVISVYLFLVGTSFVWAFSSFEIGGSLDGKFEAQKIQNIDDQNFVLTNQSASVWHDVRIVLNDRYLAKIEKLKADERHPLRPEDFRYYFNVPRPWGAEEWERIPKGEKPQAAAPGNLSVEKVRVRVREGKVEVTFSSES